MDKNEKNKEHADFQDSYRRSSNFRDIQHKEKFVIEGDGDLHLKKNEKEKNGKDK